MEYRDMGLELLLGILLAIRKKQETSPDPEDDHWNADKALLLYIGDARITEAFKSIEKWYE